MCDCFNIRATRCVQHSWNEDETTVTTGEVELTKHMVEPLVVHAWILGVRDFLYLGNIWAVGLSHDGTVIKFPLYPISMKEHLNHSTAIMEILGTHPRIVQFLERGQTALRFEYVPGGRLDSFIQYNSASISRVRKVKWCIQAAEALDYIHSKHIIHSDIEVTNFLVSANGDLKLGDIEGQHINSKGEIMDTLEGARAVYRHPKAEEEPDAKHDIFALGTVVFAILLHRLPWAELDPAIEEDESEIETRFKNEDWPKDLDGCMWGNIVKKCWKLQYATAADLLNALKQAEAACLLQDLGTLRASGFSSLNHEEAVQAVLRSNIGRRELSETEKQAALRS